MFLSSTPEAPAGQRFLKLSFDSRTAELIGEDTQQGGLMSAIRIFHRDMFLGLPGELFLGVMGLLFVIAIVSGIVLYAPFMRRLSFGAVRRAGAPRVKWLDLHNLIGGVALVWLLAVGITGVINTISLPLFSAWRAEVMPELIAPHLGKSPLGKWADVDDVVATARRAIDGNTPASIIFPTVARFGTPRHFIVWTKGSTPITSRLFTPAMLDAETGQLVTAQGLPWYLRALPSRRGCCHPRPSQTRTSGLPASGSSRVSFAHGTAYWWTILAVGSGCRASMARKRDHGRLLWRPRRASHFFHIRVIWW
ncbi:hypothetical protein ACVIU7_009366 [Bradyrhizobium liaoningense]